MVKNDNIERVASGYGIVPTGSGSFVSLITNDYGGQIRLSYNEEKIFVRFCSGSQFGEWKEIQFV